MSGPATAGRPPSAPEGGRPPRRRRAAALAALAAGVVLAVTGTVALVTDRSPAPEQVDRGALPLPHGTDGHTATQHPRAAPPMRIRISAIGLDHALIGLRVQQDGHLGVPQRPDQIGWWSDGPRPGDPGAAVIVGHVDSATGPAAFYGLSSLHPGDTISVERGDHTKADFTVRALRQYEKDAFPDDQVYVTAGPPVLRLITCGGSYDRERGGYRDNVVVYATLKPPASKHS
ncbi:class F sortase [Streptomyces sp. NBC_00370]|uniref:class F sortase n=2 Tax=unclassified Streptomyces TaxID=2593676 RepID=UPI002E274385